jgi:hypothetical protein
VRRLALALAAVALGLAGCQAGSRVVLPVALDETPLTRYPDDFTTDEAAVRGVAGLLVHDLGLPVPPQVVVYMYGSRWGFEQGLVSDGRLSAVRAAELSEFAIGVSKRRQLLLLLPDAGGPQTEADWLQLVAHELTHVAQIELANGERGEQWLAEGMAEWAGFRVLERLGLDSVERHRAAALERAREQTSLGLTRLDLDSLGTPRGFTLRYLRESSRSTYHLAFVMADYLVQRHGFAGLVAYYRGLAGGRDRREGFRLAFGQTLEEFEADMLVYLRGNGS